MGFFEPGRAVQKRKRTSGVGRERKLRHVAATPEPKSNALMLERLPIEVLQRIFIMAGPDNCMPQLLRYFNRIFLFDPMHPSEPWCGVLVVLLMISTWYAFDPNYLIDWRVVWTKLEQYRSILERNPIRRARNSFNELVVIISAFLEHSCVVLDVLMSKRFMSSAVLKRINYEFKWAGKKMSGQVLHRFGVSEEFVDSSNIGMWSSHVPVVNHLALIDEAGSRVNYIAAKFKEVGLWLDRTRENITVEELDAFVEPLEVDSTLIIADDTGLYQRLEALEPNVDKPVPTTATTLMSQEDELPRVKFFGPLLEAQLFPHILYRHGVYGQRRGDLITQLYRQDYLPSHLRLMEATIDEFIRNHPQQLFKEVVQPFFDLGIDSDTIKPVFNLCHQYPKTAEFTSVLESMLKHYFHIGAAANAEELWGAVADLKDQRLAQVLYQYAPVPNQDVLLLF